MSTSFTCSILKNPLPRLCRRAACHLLIVAALLLGAAGVQAQNTPDVYLGVSGVPLSLLDGNNWYSGLPGSSSDAVFDGAAAPAIFTMNAGPFTVGSLNVTTNAGVYSIRNETTDATDSTLTLGGATGNSVLGSSSLDLIYVTNGAALNLIGTNGASPTPGTGKLIVALAQNGNFNIETNASLVISADISGAGFSLNKTGPGALTLTGNFSGSGGVTNVAGFNTHTSLSTYTGPTAFKGGTHVFNSITT